MCQEIAASCNSWLGCGICIYRAHSRFAPSQWETVLLCNDVSHWLGASLESAQYLCRQEVPVQDSRAHVSQNTGTGCVCWEQYMVWGWGRYKMATILQTTFSHACFCMKIVVFCISVKFVPMGVINDKPASIGSDNGMAPVRRQAIA